MRPFRPTVKLGLEGLEVRLVPSVAATVSPPEMPVVTAAATLYNDAIKTVETAISAHQHLADTIRERFEAALNHHHTITPFDAPPVNNNPQHYYWMPQFPQLNDFASTGQNWWCQETKKRGTEQNGPNAIVVFDGNMNNNDDIVWDTGNGTRNGYVFLEMMLGNPDGQANTKYSGTQFIN